MDRSPANLNETSLLAYISKRLKMDEEGSAPLPPVPQERLYAHKALLERIEDLRDARVALQGKPSAGVVPEIRSVSGMQIIDNGRLPE